MTIKEPLILCVEQTNKYCHFYLMKMWISLLFVLLLPVVQAACSCAGCTSQCDDNFWWNYTCCGDAPNESCCQHMTSAAIMVIVMIILTATLCFFGLVLPRCRRTEESTDFVALGDLSPTPVPTV